MRNSAPRLLKMQADEQSVLDVPSLKRYSEGWLLTCEIDQHSERTIDARRRILDKFFWFLDFKQLTECGIMEIRQFLAHVTNGHKLPGGRWGAALDKPDSLDARRQLKPVSRLTVWTYHNHLHTFFEWLVAEGALGSSPMERIPASEKRHDQITPFSQAHIQAMLEATKTTCYSHRDKALVLFLWDTGVRASELCDLTFSNLDMESRSCIVLGKGDKRRTVYFGKTTAQALWKYVNDIRAESEDDDPVFLSEKGGSLTRSGLNQLIHRIGAKAGIHTVRVSPHTFRHTFAIDFLRNGGNIYSLQQLLGHTNLDMCKRYLALAEADMQQQHRMHSPADVAMRKKRKR